MADKVGFEHLPLNQLAGAWLFYEECWLSESIMNCSNDRNGMKAFARVVQVNVQFYRSLYIKLAFSLSPELPVRSVTEEQTDGSRPLLGRLDDFCSFPKADVATLT